MCGSFVFENLFVIEVIFGNVFDCDIFVKECFL